MAKFQMKELIGTEPITARLGAGSGSANYVTDVEIGKSVKLAGDSQYNLCAAGDQIEGFITAVETYTADDFSIGTVQFEGRKRVTLDGLQATPGTGAITVGQYVLAAAPAAIQTAETLSTTMRVVSATNQATAATAAFKARVVSLGPVGTGAVGTAIVIELL